MAAQQIVIAGGLEVGEVRKITHKKGGDVMPFGDGTGPAGAGKRGGRGSGGGRSQGGRGQGGKGRGGMGAANQAGPIGECVCPACGARVPHQQGVPCTSMQCPSCGAKMTR